MSKMWRFVKISSSNFLMITILSLSYLKSEIKSAVLSIWQDNWDNGETVCSTHDIVPRVSNKPVEWNREDKIFVSGHGPFPSYLHRFNLRTHDNCSCGEKGDPIHYATKCESNTEPAGESVASSPVSEEPPVPGTTDELVSCETPVNCSEEASLRKRGIDKDVQDEIEKEESHWKAVLHSIVDVIIHLAKQGSHLRGSNEKLDFSNPRFGKFLNTIELVSHYYLPLREHILRHRKGQVTYFSSKIQNEFLEIISNKIREHIMEEVKEAQYQAVMFDCTP
ncbi:hypothetical protein AVEN_50874-2 [Araneus ventricosus]|uniref:Uncharacterized protein n=1 Tax=Araneus ventricosus TaxID=182803 RepID=A0A4Y2M930_ARAVE|nr:hypothetical protein AVEN_50874-2 [Araneus ventricosus]